MAEKINPLAYFDTLITEEPSLLIEDLWDSAKAFLLQRLLVLQKKHLLVISSHDEDRLFQDCRFFAKDQVIDFPSWETLPGEEIAPSSDIVGKRLKTLFELLNDPTPKIILTSLPAALQKVPSPALLQETSLTWKVGDTVSFDTLSSLLDKLGYTPAPVVSDKGEYALRCGRIDLFPLSSTDPYRVEFFGNTLSDIRTFDPISQKSHQKVSSLFISAGSEKLLLQDPVCLFSYFSSSACVVFNDLLALEDRAVALHSMPGSQSPLFLSMDSLLNQALTFPHLFFASHTLEALSQVAPTKEGLVSFEMWGRAFTTKRWNSPFQTVPDFFLNEILSGIKNHPEMKISFVCTSQADQNHLTQMLHSFDLSFPPSSFTEGYLSSGFVLEDSALIPITEFSHRATPRRQKWRTTHHAPASEFHVLQKGDLIVHFHHGVGQYLGVEKKTNHLGEDTEFLVLEYDQGSKLFVPASQSYLVSRYIGAHEETPKLHTLGSSRWQNLKNKTQKAIVGYAHDLLKHDAERSCYQKIPYPVDSNTMLLFEKDFPFVETEDQQRAIEAIKQDLCSDKPMDRLICGDVGYGKTEVAMRAAFKAVIDGGGQVALLVPTTVLALQHYETFKNRMGNFPLRIAHVSRFVKPLEVKKTLEEVKQGKVDILIGTHRMIGEDVHFHNLRLLIIDEEQRFGVRAKEYLKKRKVGVDCLTLSATPIPRTLYLSLIRLRNISVIHTPPQDRLPIKSILAEQDDTLIQNALLRELSRKGQAFFIHNRVDSIFLIADKLKTLLPQAQIAVGHGQMSADELDTVFHSFKSGAADILVATTLIENGIDIPNANTILIDRADTFGLADLYQMRGRVGRWNKPAYAYFLVPKNRSLSEIADKRLSALVSASGYGAGMKVAMRDLEIRGAGDILGSEQSGNVSSVGFHLYCKLLTKAVLALKKQQTISFTETRMEFSYPASFPEDYISASSVRMELYHRFGDASSHEELSSLFQELLDRFGPPPLPTRFLYHLARLRLFAMQHKFTLLKMETYTLTAERQDGKKCTKKTLPLPQTKKPDLLEQEVTHLLKTHFLYTAL